MTAKYTPAPWINDNGLVNGIESRSRFGNTPSFDLFDASDYPAEMRDEMMATAQLISAAPDLLEALKCLVQRLDSHFGTGADWKEQEQARLAIAKAERRTSHDIL